MLLAVAAGASSHQRSRFPRDVPQPRALDGEAPGLAEALRARGALKTPYSNLSRGVAGFRGGTVIVNFPGSTGGVRDGLAVLDPVLDHAVELSRGTSVSHAPRTPAAP